MEFNLIPCKTLENFKNGSINNYGEKHPEKDLEEETHRTNFRRQRDRILYTGGFRRLQDKTQVMSTMKPGDHRTRLTHTLEVEQIAISISDALMLNSDLVSAIAIGHDVGHTPFGHAVERVLNEKLKHYGGFSHAIQSAKYIDGSIRNSKTCPEVLSLQDIIIEGVLKHDTDVYTGDYDDRQWQGCSKYNLNNAGTLEMQVVYWSDKIAYLSHDFEDFYKTEIYVNAKNSAKEDGRDLENELKKCLSGLIKGKDIEKDINNFNTRDLIRNVLENLLNHSISNINSYIDYNSADMQNLTSKKIVDKELKLLDTLDLNHKYIKDYYKSFPKNYIEEYTLDNLKTQLKKHLDVAVIKGIQSELLEYENLKNTNPNTALELEGSIIEKAQLIKLAKKIKKDAYMNSLLINFDDDYRIHYLELRKIIDAYYISSPEITRSDAKAKKIAQSLFEEFISNTNLLPLNIRKKIDDSSNCDPSKIKERVVADYIASMTDRYAEAIYSNLNAIGGTYNY